jgi:hypothetical protein
MNRKIIWIIDEGSQGHVVQSRGLVRELAKAVPLESFEVKLQTVPTLRFARSMTKRLLRLAPRKWMFQCLHPKVKFPDSVPDLIVSSGPHSLPTAEFLSKFHGCPSVFVQGTIEVPRGAVTAIMRPFEGYMREDYIFIPMLFTEITPEVVDREGKVYLSSGAIRPQGTVNTLFIGNSSSKIRFSPADWDGLVRFVNGLWENTGSQWLITTSSRTGRELDDLFKRGINPAAILEAVWYSESPRKVTKPFLGLADRVFVTMDSLTMLTEAIASGRPTFAICPSEIREEPSNTHLRYVNGIAEKGLIIRLHPGLTTALPSAPSAVLEIDYSGPIHELIKRIGWKC